MGDLPHVDDRPDSEAAASAGGPVIIPPKPAARAARVSLWRYLRLFRADLLSAQPAKLYRAWMAELDRKSVV